MGNNNSEIMKSFNLRWPLKDCLHPSICRVGVQLLPVHSYVKKGW